MAINKGTAVKKTFYQKTKDSSGNEKYIPIYFKNISDNVIVPSGTAGIDSVSDLTTVLNTIYTVANAGGKAAQSLKNYVTLSTYNAKVATYDSAIEALQTASDDYSTRIGTLEKNQKSNTEAISSNTAEISTIKGLIDTNSGDIGTLKTKVANAEKNISTYAGQITTAQGDITALSERVGSAEGQINTNKSAISTINTKIENLTTGKAQNLAYDTKSDMLASVAIMKNTDLRIGDNIFIRTTEEPDYWVSSINSTSVSTAVNGNREITIGYYTLQELETKTSFSGYQTADEAASAYAPKSVNKNITIGSISKKLTDGNGAVNAVLFTSAEIKAAAGLSNVANKSLDTVVTADSGNYITSGGVASAISTAKSSLEGSLAGLKKTVDEHTTSIQSLDTRITTAKGVADTALGKFKSFTSDITKNWYSAVQITADGVVSGVAQFLVYASSEEDAVLNDIPVGGFAII